MPRPLLIGVGMPHAGDDAAGRLVAQRLAGREQPFDIAEAWGIAADLVMLFEGRERVLIVDACRSGAPPGTIHRIDATSGTLPGYLSSVSSHGIGVAEGIRLAEALARLPRHCEVWAIEGANFSLGAPITPAVRAAIDVCVREIPDLLSDGD
jgi:hydrogenase maturation protease